MNVDIVLAAFEEYVDIKRASINNPTNPILIAARKRLETALNDYFADKVTAYLGKFLDDTDRKIRTPGNATQKINISGLDNTFAWTNIVKLMDALNSSPDPLEAKTDHKKWMISYENWYKIERLNAIRSISPPHGTKIK